MYKDKDKQREASRERQRRYKARHKGVTSEGVTDKALPGEPIPQGWEDEMSDNLERTGNIQGTPKRGKDIKYKMTVMERLFYRPAYMLKSGETNFVSLPGWACYGVVRLGSIYEVKAHEPSLRPNSLDSKDLDLKGGGGSEKSITPKGVGLLIS